jgi:hypothetical protein
MSFTAEEFERVLDALEFNKGRYHLKGAKNFYTALASRDINNVSTVFGQAKFISYNIESDSWDSVSGPSELIFSINDERFFRKNGYESSWDDTSWDGVLVEVVRVPVTTYEYKEID